MDKLEKTIVILGIILVILLVGMFLQNINGNGKHITNSTSTKILTLESKAIESSSPIQIKHWKVFGSGANITKKITYQQQALFYDNLSVNEIEYNGIYFPVSITIGDLLENSTFVNTSLVDKKVYLDFITNNYKNASALYTINKIYTKGNMFYWILGQDTGISNNSAILDNTSYSIAENSASQLNGIEFLNQTGFLSPKNPTIDNELLLHKKS